MFVTEGALAYLDNWGGSTVIQARVERIEPAGFTEVSALGIEEQRVNTVLTLSGNADNWPGLGHNFRVYVRIIVWEAESVLRVPVSAIFRHDAGWAVFVNEDNVARLVQVQLGQRNSHHAEVVGGLIEGQPVVLHPSDRIGEGIALELREVE